MKLAATYDIAVIGGGFFGCMIALRLREQYPNVIVLESGHRLLGKASYHNQARVHNGYHYPRSFLTAFRSRLNFPRFVADFPNCIDSSFEKYYAVARKFSKVSAVQYRHFFERVGASIKPAPDRVRNLFDQQLIAEVFEVEEFAFDADKLADQMRRELASAGVEVRFGQNVLTVSGSSNGRINLHCEVPDGPETIRAGQVFNCTYSRLNQLLIRSGLPSIPLKHELTEMALIDVPAALRGLGVTVMCGPFFSCMPFPPRGLHTLSHVRFTPQASWRDDDSTSIQDLDALLDRSKKTSRYQHMLCDSARYLPILKESQYKDSLWEIKTVLPSSEVSDSRPILMRTHHGLPNFHCVLGAKIDNIYDALDEIARKIFRRRAG